VLAEGLADWMHSMAGACTYTHGWLRCSSYTVAAGCVLASIAVFHR
jgi:hypothetical protein